MRRKHKTKMFGVQLARSMRAIRHCLVFHCAAETERQRDRARTRHASQQTAQRKLQSAGAKVVNVGGFYYVMYVHCAVCIGNEHCDRIDHNFSFTTLPFSAFIFCMFFCFCCCVWPAASYRSVGIVCAIYGSNRI